MRTQLSVKEVESQEGQQPQARPAPLTTIIIPAYNEVEGLPVVLSKLFAVINDTYEVIVIDDGSTDGTAEAAAGFPCRVVSHKVNRGKGKAVQTGIAAARGEKIIVIDSDNTYPVQEVPRIARELTEFDMVMASRVRGQQNIPAFNRLGNVVFRSLIRRLYGFKPHDPLTGLYGVKKASLMMMRLDSSDFGIESEITIKGARMGLKMAEIPIEYGGRIGMPKLRGLRDGYRIFRTIIKMLALYSPTVMFVLPGGILFSLGLMLLALLMSGPFSIGDLSLQVHSFIVATMVSLAGFQLGVFGFTLNLYGLSHRFIKPDFATRLFLRNRMGRNLSVIGLLICTIGLGLSAWLASGWINAGLGEFTDTKPLVLALFMSVFGLQMIFSSVFLSIFTAELGRGEEDAEASFVSERLAYENEL